MKIFEELGQIALGSRIRLIGDKITKDSEKIYQAYQIDIQPKWFPVYYALSKGETKKVTAIANEIGHSHVSVSKIVAEMTKYGYIKEEKDPKDRRCTLVSLTSKGLEINDKIKFPYTDISSALDDIKYSSATDLWTALHEWDEYLNKKSLLERVLEKKNERENDLVKIVNYDPRYKEAFRDLNLAWIKKHFVVEDEDRKSLEDPDKTIIAQGGYIFVALMGNKPVGVCALIMREDLDHPYELAKMAVAPEARGKKIGLKLAEAIIQKARDIKTDHIFLESNRSLTPAISLYRKLGFEEISGIPSHYARSNIQMILRL
jgi:ribosomal protein S18 acetylase RimI-like enzyme/predicted transcriptional regulator